MMKISTGEDSTLKNYMKIAVVFGPKAVNYIQKLIDESPNGENEEIIAEEQQMLMLFASMMEK